MKVNSSEFSPVIILGAARSGTTLLGGTIISRHPQVFFFAEPAYIWTYGNAFRSDDVLDQSDARPIVKEYITSRFLEVLEASGKKVFVEKTPSNVFRVPFILSVFPNARIVHLVRDGRAVALSASEEWIGRGAKALDSKTVRGKPFLTRILGIMRSEVKILDRVRDFRSFLELFAYAPRYFRFLLRQTFHNSRVVWGPRFPGINQVRRTHSLLDTCALQWAYSVNSVERTCSSLGKDQYLRMQYEKLLESPEDEVEKLLKFMGLDSNREILDELTQSISVEKKVNSWEKELSKEELRSMESLISSTLVCFEYDLCA